MSKVTLNPIIDRLSGSFGKIVFRQRGGVITMAHRPNVSGVVRTTAQLVQQERFRQAALYGHAALADPQMRLPYAQAAERTGKPVFALVVADYLVAPVIDAVDLSSYTGKIGDKLIIHAHDDFEVTTVQVSLLDGSGTELEKGPAVEEPTGSGRWFYVTKAAVTPGTHVQVSVSASDRPGNHANQLSQKIV